MSAVREEVAASLRKEVEKYTSGTDLAPAAVFWGDPTRSWGSVIHLIQEVIPVLVLGDYDPEHGQGPAVWLRAALATHGNAAELTSSALKLPDYLARPSEKNPWVIYLPGFSREDFGDAESMDRALQPLAELVLRSNWWVQPTNRSPWTPHGFLSSQVGANLKIPKDDATKAALLDNLATVLGEDIAALRAKGTLDAGRLNSLAMPDSTRNLLAWISDPQAAKEQMSATQWRAFCSTVKTDFGIDPMKATPIEAAAKLGAREGAWSPVWQRYSEAPDLYPGVRAALDKGRPQTLFGADPHPDSWPSWNTEQEDALRASLLALAKQGDPASARAEIAHLEAAHRDRQDSVWARVGDAPLAMALPKLCQIADVTATTPSNYTVPECVTWYADKGHKADRIALELLSEVTSGRPRDAVRDVLSVIYDPWVDDTASVFQAVSVRAYPGEIGLDVPLGTCVVFVDALRYDLGVRLAERLAPLEVAVAPRVTAFPTVTPTGQPSVLPVSDADRSGWGAGPDFDGADNQGRSLKGDVLSKVLAAARVQHLSWAENEVGDVTGRAWTANNQIDSLGHGHDLHLVEMLDAALDRIADRTRQLLAAGWQRVVVVTDHGFLLPMRPARKVELPLAVTEGDAARKPRVARLKTDARRPSFPIIPWTWDKRIDMVSAPGASAFVARTMYEHGGLSPQECITPVLTVTAGQDSAVESALAATIEGIRWTGQRCRIDFIPVDAAVKAEVRTHAGDPTSVVGGPVAPKEPGEARVLVADDEHSGQSAFVVLTDDSGTVVAQQSTVVGGE